MNNNFFEIVLYQSWKMINELKMFFLIPFNFLNCLISGLSYDFSWKLYGFPILQIDRRSRVKIGKRMNLRSFPESNPLSPLNRVVISTRSKDAMINIGDDFAMTGGGIIAQNKIKIGNRVSVGANCWIMDTDFHPLDKNQRRLVPNEGKSKPIIIGDDVFIGTQSIILKGVKIGNGAVIGAGSVVTKEVFEDTIVAGNPAKSIRKYHE